MSAINQYYYFLNKKTHSKPKFRDIKIFDEKYIKKTVALIRAYFAVVFLNLFYLSFLSCYKIVKFEVNYYAFTQFDELFRNNTYIVSIMYILISDDPNG